MATKWTADWAPLCCVCHRDAGEFRWLPSEDLRVPVCRGCEAEYDAWVAAVKEWKAKHDGWHRNHPEPVMPTAPTTRTVLEAELQQTRNELLLARRRIMDLETDAERLQRIEEMVSAIVPCQGKGRTDV